MHLLPHPKRQTLRFFKLGQLKKYSGLLLGLHLPTSAERSFHPWRHFSVSHICVRIRANRIPLFLGRGRAGALFQFAKTINYYSRIHFGSLCDRFGIILVWLWCRLEPILVLFPPFSGIFRPFLEKIKMCKLCKNKPPFSPIKHLFVFFIYLKKNGQSRRFNL